MRTRNWEKTPEGRKKLAEAQRRYRARHRERILAKRRARYRTPEGKKKRQEEYAARSARLSESGKRRYLAFRELVNYSKDKPCLDCGVKYPPYVMDFDHRPGEKKRAIISCMWQFSLKTVEEEIAKCDVVCANCHRIRTHDRDQHSDKNNRNWVKHET